QHQPIPRGEHLFVTSRMHATVACGQELSFRPFEQGTSLKWCEPKFRRDLLDRSSHVSDAFSFEVTAGRYIEIALDEASNVGTDDGFDLGRRPEIELSLFAL